MLRVPLILACYPRRVCNVVSPSDVLESITIPDVPAGQLLQEAPYAQSTNESTTQIPHFSMGVGDFVDIYGGPDEREAWNGIVTCFFVGKFYVMISVLYIVYDRL